MTLSSLMNAAMTEQMRNLLLVDHPIHIPRPYIPTTPEEQARAFIHEVTGVSPQQQIEMEKIQEGADRLYLKHKATDLAKGTDTASQIVDEFKKTMTSKDTHEVVKGIQLRSTKLPPAQLDTYTKICNDQRPPKPMSWASSLQNEYSKIRNGRPIEQQPGAGERHIYLQLLDHPNTLKDPDLHYVQAYDAREALTSPSKANSDAAFERMATRFRLEPDLNPTPAIKTLLETRETANRQGKLGSLIGPKK